MTKRALLIGINYFNTPSELYGCQNDVKEMKKLLTDQNYTEIVVLLDKRKNTSLNTPTKSNILAKILEMVAKTKKNDMLFIHYSGHGTYTKDQNNDEKDSRDEQIYTVDGKVITDDELNNILIKPFPEGAKLRALFDCCFSGSILDLPIRYDENSKIQTENNNTSVKDIVMISGCADNQTSADAFIDREFSGALTWAFILSFKKLYIDKKNTWKDLIQEIRYNINDKGYSQLSQLNTTNKNMLLANIEI